ncbi:Alcohol dehydrogenase superfamily zinc-type [Penicillium angulare]|uniref:Alcohol dehydrogenase superfamily zinc-type n=1 Tax=Penicillium angulare TaxID=116970 RepID=A0A9W9JZN2_9EURO|nr:Alcohol dehydrogenase superfamily zinc-type [Penicillium angulare]
MYSSIKKSKARPGDWLAILGAGGGLGHIGDKKQELCMSLGATKFLDFRKEDIVQSAKAATSGLGVHGVICTANGEKAYEQSMQMLRPLGTLVCVGIPHIPFRLPATPFEMIVKGLSIVGNSAGTAQEMDELLAMALAGDVKAHIEVFELQEIVDVLQRLERSEIEGRAVLKIPV